MSVLAAMLLLSAPAVLDADERASSVVLVVAPRGGAVPTSALIDAAVEAIEAGSELHVRSAEQAGIDPRVVERCPRDVRLSCWVRAARPDFVPERSRRNLAADFPQVLFAVIAQSIRDEALSIVVASIDLEAALTVLGRRRSAADTEDAIFSLAHRTAAHRVDLRDRAALSALSALFRRLAQHDLRQVLARAGERGTVRVRGGDGLALGLDGRRLGVLTGADAQVINVQPGLRQVGLWAGSQAVLTTTVTIAARSTVTVLAPSVGTPPAHPSRAPILWGGVGFVAAGVALGAVALAAGDGGVDARCLRRPGDGSCDGPGFTSFAPSAEATPTGDADAIDDPSVAAGPLAAALLITGASAMVGALVTDPEEPPWVGVVVGLLAGAIGYGAAVAAGG